MNPKSYDIIIVGGGISGLYTAYKALLKNPHTSILLLEASNRLGGRIQTYHDKNYQSIEIGAGRFNKTHTHLWNLIKDLNLEQNIVPISSESQYISSKYSSSYKTSQIIHKVLNASKKTSDQKLKNIIFLEYAKQVLQNDQESQFLLDSFGYSSELTNMNAYDTIKLLKQYSQDFFVLKGGVEQIIVKLHEKLSKYPNFQVLLKTPVTDITYNQNVFYINQTYQSKVCVCAIIKEHLEKIPIFRPIKPTLQGIKNLPLCRIYTHLEPNLLPKTKMTTNNKLRYIIPIKNTPTEAIYMISYTDNKYANYWKTTYETKSIQGVKQALKKNIQKIFPEIPSSKIAPKYTKVFYYKHGVAYFQPGFDSTTQLKKIRHPYPNIPLYVCGENYSEMNAQWIEGALDTIPKLY